MTTNTNSTRITDGTVGVHEDQDIGFVGFEDTVGGFGGVSDSGR
jgi:hypothetical protein